MEEISKKLGEPTPLVYTSPEVRTAQRYPISLADEKNNACGEVVAHDICYLRLYITCAVHAEKRIIKIRRRRNNKQDGFLPGDVWPVAITFCAYRTAPPEQLANYQLAIHKNVIPKQGDTLFWKGSLQKYDQIQSQRSITI